MLRHTVSCALLSVVTLITFSATSDRAAATEPVAGAAPAERKSLAGGGDDLLEEQRIVKQDSADRAGEAAAGSRPETGPAAGPDVMQLMLALGLVLALIVGGTYLLRRLKLGARGLQRGIAIEILARNNINPKQSLCLVRFADRLLFLGVSPNHIGALDKVDDPEEVARLTGRVETATPQSIANTFGDLFHRESKEFKDDDDEPGEPADLWDNGTAYVQEAQQWDHARHEVNTLLEKVKGLSRFCFQSRRSVGSEKNMSG